MGLDARQKWIVENSQGKSILNIGFVGKGPDGLELHNAICKNNSNAFVVGLDIDLTTMSAIKIKNSVCGDVLAIPFKDNTFDTVIVGELIEHFYSIEHLIQNLSKVLKNKGKIIITSPNPFEFSKYLKYWIFKREKTIGHKDNIKGYMDYYDHKNIWNPLSVANILIDHGFEINTISTRGLLIPYIKPKYTSWINPKIWPFTKLGTNFCIVAFIKKR